MWYVWLGVISLCPILVMRVMCLVICSLGFSVIGNLVLDSSVFYKLLVFSLIVVATYSVGLRGKMLVMCFVEMGVLHALFVSFLSFVIS